MKAEQNPITIEKITDHFGDYVETYVKLGVVNSTQKATVIASVALSAALLSVFCLFLLLFAGIGVAIWLGETWGNPKAGYFTIAGFYVFCALIFAALNKKIISPALQNYIIKKVYE